MLGSEEEQKCHNYGESPPNKDTVLRLPLGLPHYDSSHPTGQDSYMGFAPTTKYINPKYTFGAPEVTAGWAHGYSGSNASQTLARTPLVT